MAQAGDDDDLLEGIDDAPAATTPTVAPEDTAEEPPPPPRPSAPKAQVPLESGDPDSEAEAETDGDLTAGALDRIKAVPKKPLLKRRRLEISPMMSTTLNDAYYRHFALSGDIAFFPHDSIGLGIGIDWLYAHAKSDVVDVVRYSETSVLAEFVLPTFFGHVDFQWAPFYGKLSLFDSFIVHFDGYAKVGFGLAKMGRRTPPAAHFAIGQRYCLWDWVTLRLELRDHVFLDKQQVNGNARSDIQSYVMLLAGASFFFPPSFEYTYR